MASESSEKSTSHYEKDNACEKTSENVKNRFLAMKKTMYMKKQTKNAKNQLLATRNTTYVENQAKNAKNCQFN